MATEYSFDVVSKVDINEVKNAIDQAEKEVAGRFDFRNSKASMKLEEETIKVLADNEMQLEALLDIIRSKMAKRSVSLKALEYGKVESASGGAVRQVVTLKQGIPIDSAKELVRDLKSAGVKVNAQIQGDQLRISAKDKDALQSAQTYLKKRDDLPFDVAFNNYR